MPEITLEHIRDLIQGARDESRAYDEGIRTEIRGVNHRLDKVNGRLNDHGERLGVLESAPHLHQRSGDRDATPHARSDDGKAVTRRDVKMVMLGGAGLWGVIKGGIWLLSQVKDAL